MTNKAKKQICPIPKRFRKRISLTIDPEAHEYIKEEGFKASRFLDQAIYALKETSRKATILITTNNARIIPEIKKQDGPAEIRTQDLRHVKATS